MNAIDLILLLVVAASALLGLMRGFVGVVASLLAWAAATWCAFRYGGHIAFLLSDDGQPGATGLLAGYALAFFGVLVAVTLVGWMMRKLLHSVGLSGLDRSLGLVLGLVRGVLVACVLVLLMAFSALPREPAWKQSRALPVLLPGAQWLAQWLPDWAAGELDFGNGRAGGDNGLLHQAGAVVETITGSLPAPVDTAPPAPAAEPAPGGQPASSSSPNPGQ